jgi:membrane associated rhomboid family serine protease
MQQPPPLAQCFRYPITTCLAALAIMGTLRWRSGADISRFMIGSDQWWLEPWRLVTPVLFHGNVFHLIFNLYVLWLFGTKVEDEFGHGRTLGIYVLLAVGSNTAEQALFFGGVGLSGVVYGLFGLLWVLSRRDPRFRGAMDRQTVQFLVGWFFLCIVLTITDVMKVANVAHGAGCVLGAMLGWTISARNFGPRLGRGAVLAATLLLCIMGGTVARPYVNLAEAVGPDLAYSGYLALEKGDNQRAVALYEKAVAIDTRHHDWWWNLAIAYRRLGRFAEANDAYSRAAALKEPDQPRSD